MQMIHDLSVIGSRTAHDGNEKVLRQLSLVTSRITPSMLRMQVNLQSKRGRKKRNLSHENLYTIILHASLTRNWRSDYQQGGVGERRLL